MLFGRHVTVMPSSMPRWLHVSPQKLVLWSVPLFRCSFLACLGCFQGFPPTGVPPNREGPDVLYQLSMYYLEENRPDQSFAMKWSHAWWALLNTWA